MNEPADRSLGKIALSLSGGGFRAAAFHLGTLDVLHAVGLLPEVLALSTVSGGTIVGAAYALSAARQEPFPAFYARFYECLQQRPLKTAVDLLQGPRAADLPGGTLIAAQAAAYDALFFHDARFGVILNRQRPCHLQEVAFNATDFAWGLPFRFQHSRQHGVRIGNARHSIPRRAAKRLRLADIVAASSCFPGGYEPLRFPDDFHWDDRQDVDQLLGQRAAERFRPPAPLMDGGVADNQGLNSLLAAVDRIDRGAAPGSGIGMILLSDVDRPAEEPLLVLGPPRLGRLRVAHLVGLAWFAGLLAVLLAAAAGGRLAWLIADGRFSWSRDGLPLVPLVALSLLTIGSLAWLRRWLRRRLAAFVLEAAGGVDVPAAVHRLRVSQLLDLLQLRLKSLLTMSRSVFMKSIRDLRYRAVYADRKYQRRIVANLIYELAAAGRPGSTNLPDWLEPSTEIRSIAGSAKRMPTVLWFQTPEQLPAVVACGRHTACYNLLVHLCRRYGPEVDGADAATREVFGRARALWQRFQEAPLAATGAALECAARTDPATPGERDSL